MELTFWCSGRTTLAGTVTILNDLTEEEKQERSADFHQRHFTSVNAFCDIAVSLCGVVIVGTEQRFAPSGIEGHRLILRDDAQQGQSCAIDRVVNGLVEGFQQFLFASVDDKMYLAASEPAQFHDSSLGIAQAAGLGSSDNDGASGPCQGQLESCSQAGWGVYEAVIKPLSDFWEEGLELFQVHVLSADSGRSGQQEQIFLKGVFNSCLLEGTPFSHHVGKIHDSAVGHHKGDIKVSETDIAIKAKGRMPHLSEGHADISSKRSFPSAALTGHDGDHLTQEAPPPSTAPSGARKIRRNERRNQSGDFLIKVKRLGYFLGQIAIFLIQMTR